MCSVRDICETFYKHLAKMLHKFMSDWTHLLFVQSIRGHPNELNLAMNGLFNQDNVLFVTDKKWVYWVNLWTFSTHLETSTLMWVKIFTNSIELVNSFVVSHNTEHTTCPDWTSKVPIELKHFWHDYTEWTHSKRTSGQVETDKKCSVNWVFVNIFNTFGDVYTDVEWLNTSVVCS